MRQPIMTCPQCGTDYEDFDGLGVVCCPACGYCTHAAGEVIDGKMICSYCDQVIED